MVELTSETLTISEITAHNPNFVYLSMNVPIPKLCVNVSVERFRMLRVVLLLLMFSTSLATAQSLHRYAVQSMFPDEQRDPMEEKKIDALLNSGKANLEERNESGYTPLYVATMFNNTRFMKKLIDAGANINSQNQLKETPLHLAAGYQKIETVRLLVSEGANLESKDQYGATPLHEAVSMRKGDSIEYLIESGADVNAVTKYGVSVLHTSIGHSSYIELVRMLIAASANVNYGTPKYELFPLHYAMDENEYKIFELLIESGADVNALGAHGNSILHVAKKRDTKQYFIQRLEELGAKDICTRCTASTKESSSE